MKINFKKLGEIHYFNFRIDFKLNGNKGNAKKLFGGFLFGKEDKAGAKELHNGNGNHKK